MQHQGLGMCLDGAVGITSDLLWLSIREIERGPYRETIHKLNVIFREAGARRVEHATDFIEYYQRVCYSHLVPSWTKYIQMEHCPVLQRRHACMLSLQLHVVVVVIGFTLYKCTRSVCRRLYCVQHYAVANKTTED